MKIQSIVAALIVVTIFALLPSVGFSQISSGANGVVPTEYSGANQDSIHIFCGRRGETNASLTATSPNGVAASIEWQKYNALTGSFDLFPNVQLDSTTSVISNLQDGAYRVNITSESGVITYTAWVFNNYIETAAEITDSDCNSFTLKGTSDSPVFTYVDLVTRQPKELNKGIQVRWTTGDEAVSQFLVSQVFSPPTKDTDYKLTVSDRFNCTSESVVTYISIVTKASFTYVREEQTESYINTDKREAPLPVVFTNTSENGDALKFEWFIYKSREDIIRESVESPGTVIDSFLTKIYSDSPIYVFEKPGSYNVKLVSQKKSEFNTCFDTVYIDKFIVVEESFIEAPNFFTPGNGDGQNDNFTVRFLSMKSVKISIFNRWGKAVHVWENNNVQGFGPTKKSNPEAVWDGKVGGKLATPGVYYYVVDGMGRDDKRRKANGFIHLFRDK